jgi:hypothetical protein
VGRAKLTSVHFHISGSYSRRDRHRYRQQVARPRKASRRCSRWVSEQNRRREQCRRRPFARQVRANAQHARHIYEGAKKEPGWITQGRAAPSHAGYHSFSIMRIVDITHGKQRSRKTATSCLFIITPSRRVQFFSRQEMLVGSAPLSRERSTSKKARSNTAPARHWIEKVARDNKCRN